LKRFLDGRRYGLICPTGYPVNSLSRLSSKNFSLFSQLKSVLCPPPSRLDERGVRVVTDVAAGCGGRGGARDEALTSRTAKPCGPDAPTLAFKLVDDTCVSRRRWWQESPVTRESTEETVKTIAQGRPDDSASTCGDYTRVLFYLAHGAAGAAGTRSSLRPPCSRGEKLMDHSGATCAARMRNCASAHCGEQSTFRHSGARAARARNPFDRLRLEPDGFRVRCFASPRNDGSPSVARPNCTGRVRAASSRFPPGLEFDRRSNSLHPRREIRWRFVAALCIRRHFRQFS
jgi:hypothetical protein